MRLGPGQDLVDCQQAVKALRAQPFLFLDKLALDHRDLGNRPAPGEQAEAKEANEQLQQAGRSAIRLHYAGTAWRTCLGLCETQSWVSSTASRHQR